ncbi:MAG: SurA N-terminal domain-containing protein [Acidobacteriota bacterium]|nr:SurA N-terminal domain-containing protein [Acidobacteriota bacterium]
MLQRTFLCFAKAAGALALAAVLGFVSCTGGEGKREVWARVNGSPVYRDQVESVYRSRQAMLPDASKPEQELSFKLAILSELIDRTLLLDRASALQISVSDSEVDARMAAVRNSDPGGGFQKMLRSRGLTADEFRRQIHDDLVIKKLIQKEILSQVSVTPAEIAAYYSKNKRDYDEPQTKYHLAQILVTPVADPIIRNLMHDDARNNRQATRKIQALYAQVRAGKDFAQMAEDYSEDPLTAASGGDMGFIPASSLAHDPALSRALDHLQPGQITGIIRNQTGYRIYKLLGRVDAGQRPLSDESVQSSIRKTLFDEKEEVLKAALIQTLHNRGHVVNYLAQEIIDNHGSAASMR